MNDFDKQAEEQASKHKSSSKPKFKTSYNKGEKEKEINMQREIVMGIANSMPLKVKIIVILFICTSLYGIVDLSLKLIKLFL